MKQMDNIHGYEFDKADSHNSPNGVWYKAKADGREYFLKKFQWPKYPREGISSDIYEMKVRECDEWFEQKNKIIAALNELGDGAGNIVSPRNVFREKLCFYQVTYWIDANAKSLDEICRFNEDEKIMLLKTYSAALKKVHSKGIIHGDLKPENVMIGKSGSGKPVAKLIDFDDSYFSGRAFPPEQTVCTDAYQSPELAAYKRGHEEYRSILTCANDVFASGIIFHQFWTGKMPDYPGKDEGRFMFEAISAGDSYEIDDSIPSWLKELLLEMLAPKAENRPTMEEVHQWITKKGRFTEPAPMERKIEPAPTRPTVPERKPERPIDPPHSPEVTPVPIGGLAELDDLLNSIPADLSGYSKTSATRLQKEVKFAKQNRGIIDDERLLKRLKNVIEKLESSDGESEEFSIVPCVSLPSGYSRVEVKSESKVVAYLSDGKKTTLPKQVALKLGLVKLR